MMLCSGRIGTPTHVALIVLLNKYLGLSHGKVATLLRDWFGLTVRPSDAIQAGRGFPQAAAILGADVDGVLVRDGWAPYRRFDYAAHHTCLAHLLRRCRELATDYPRAAWPERVHAVLQRALAVRDRRNGGDITTQGAAIARGRLFNKLADLVDHPVRTPALQRSWRRTLGDSCECRPHGARAWARRSHRAG